MDICLEASIRLLFEILRFGYEHLGFMIFLGIIFLFKKKGLYILGLFGALVELSMKITLIGGFFLKILFFIADVDLFLRLAWIFVAMILLSEAHWMVKIVSIIPVALLGASIDYLSPIPGASILLLLLILNKNLADIFLTAISAGFVFVMITGYDTVCTILNEILIHSKEIRQEGVLQATGISKYF